MPIALRQVAPLKTSVEPEGGAISINQQLRHVLEENAKRARFKQRTAVDLAVDPTSRTNAIRDSILRFAFGEPPTAKAASTSLASRLADGMDLRSHHALFVLAASREDSKRCVTLWTFPKDTAFRLRAGNGGPSIQVLTDVFSQTSYLRKAALFEGRNHRSHFLQGWVLDFQADNSLRTVADFWISRFLDCRLAVGDDSGTRILARALQKAFDDCDDPTDLEQLYGAGMQMRRSPQKRISVQVFADRYLSGPAKNSFLSNLPSEHARESIFNFRRETFDATLQFRVFRLDTGVFVSSPLSEVGDSVNISESASDRSPERRLRCEGVVKDEKMRTRHA